MTCDDATAEGGASSFSVVLVTGGKERRIYFGVCTEDFLSKVVPS